MDALRCTVSSEDSAVFGAKLAPQLLDMETMGRSRAAAFRGCAGFVAAGFEKVLPSYNFNDEDFVPWMNAAVKEILANPPVHQYSLGFLSFTI
ncbi:hypothetical protein CYMTET_19171 [Cymbomonas tetramitiformis]|uniref:Uncharacterized protein n=1 Tax=Cymbomonas tetramitiformis TaxID=36881 RepID=A0AAE0G7V4_9CHLO|nr:hypothetical protein CYMTET_19171 [Cymbomonas tetramitiformis]